MATKKQNHIEIAVQVLQKVDVVPAIIRVMQQICFGSRMWSKDEVPTVSVHQLDAALGQGHAVANFSLFFCSAQLVSMIHLIIMISKFSYLCFADSTHRSF